MTVVLFKFNLEQIIGIHIFFFCLFLPLTFHCTTGAAAATVAADKL